MSEIRRAVPRRQGHSIRRNKCPLKVWSDWQWWPGEALSSNNAVSSVCPRATSRLPSLSSQWLEAGTLFVLELIARLTLTLTLTPPPSANKQREDERTREWLVFRLSVWSRRWPMRSKINLHCWLLFDKSVEWSRGHCRTHFPMGKQIERSMFRVSVFCCFRMIYSSASRMLCLQNEINRTRTHLSQVFIEISTSNSNPIEYSLQLENITEFLLQSVIRDERERERAKDLSLGRVYNGNSSSLRPCRCLTNSLFHPIWRMSSSTWDRTISSARWSLFNRSIVRSTMSMRLALGKDTIRRWLRLPRSTLT